MTLGAAAFVFAAALATALATGLGALPLAFRRDHVAGWLGDVVTALQAAGALPPSNPAPGQLAGLCARLGISGHGITTPPAVDMPERWLSLLTRYHRRDPRPTRRVPDWTSPPKPPCPGRSHSEKPHSGMCR